MYDELVIGSEALVEVAHVLIERGSEVLRDVEDNVLVLKIIR